MELGWLSENTRRKVIIKYKDKEEREVILNLDNVNYIAYEYFTTSEYAYIVHFTHGGTLKLTPKEFERLVKTNWT